MTEVNANCSAVELRTSFAVIPLKTVGTQTKQVFTAGQGRDGRAPVKTELTCKTKDC